MRGRSVVAAIALLAAACGTDAPVAPTGAPSPTPPPPAEGTWTTLAPMLQPRSEMAIAELGGKVYVIGGYPPGRIPSNVVQVYDPASNTWTLGPPTPVPLGPVGLVRRRG